MAWPSFSKAEPPGGRRSQLALSAAACVLLFAANAALTWRLFRIEYTTEMGSIEAAFIGLSRYIIAHFPDFAWFPLWYGGIPFQDAYPPLLHMIVAGTAVLLHVSPALAHHMVTAATYALVPVALFWAARRFGAGIPVAFAAGLGYSLTSPTCWLVREIRVTSFGWFGPRRLLSLVRWGEGPHITSMLLLVIALGTIHVALEKRRPAWYCGAAAAVAAVALANWIGAFALAVAVVCYLLAAFPGTAERAARIAAMGAGAYALAMPWLPPSTILTVRANAPLVGTSPVNATALGALAVVAGTAALAWLLWWLDLRPALRFGLLLTVAMGVVAMGGFWFHFNLVPQSERYHLEFDLAFWLMAAIALAKVRVPRPGIVMAAVAILAFPVVRHEIRIARPMEKAIDIHGTVEYQISRWLDEHMPGQRVFAPGTVSYWMNAFGDTPLLNGGFDNGERNRILPHVTFQLYAGEKRDVALDWLIAFGCDAVVGGEKGSREVYHPYSHPEKLRGLQELWRNGEDVIYAVPRGTKSLAHAVRAADLPQGRPEPYDTALLKPYVAALTDPALPPASFRWLGTSAAEITGNLRPEHLVSVQVTWTNGWTARVNGESRRMWADKIGQIVVEPRCSGPCTVELRYDGGAEAQAARCASAAAMAGGLLWMAWGILWRKRSASIRTS